jgi:hypothetical protein
MAAAIALAAPNKTVEEGVADPTVHPLLSMTSTRIIYTNIKRERGGRSNKSQPSN